MQEVTIEPVGFQPRQRTLAGRDGAGPRGVARQNYGYQKNFVAARGDRLGYLQFGIAIHLRGICARHAEMYAAAQRRSCRLAIAAIDIPGALPDHGDLRAVLAEFLLSQGAPLMLIPCAP